MINKIIVAAILLCMSIMVSCFHSQCKCELAESENYLRNETTIQDHSSYWKTYSEPSLFRSQNHSYRLLVNAMVYGRTTIYRVEKEKEKYLLHAKYYSAEQVNNKQEDFNKLDSSKMVMLNRSEWGLITKEFDEYCFWSMPKSSTINNGHLDGTYLLLEANVPENPCVPSAFHSAARISPGGSTNFVALCEVIIRLVDE